MTGSKTKFQFIANENIVLIFNVVDEIENSEGK